MVTEIIDNTEKPIIIQTIETEQTLTTNKVEENTDKEINNKTTTEIIDNTENFSNSQTIENEQILTTDEKEEKTDRETNTQTTEAITSNKVEEETDRTTNSHTSRNEQTLTNIQVDDKTEFVTIFSSKFSEKPEEVLTSQIALKTDQESTSKITDKITEKEEKTEHIDEITYMTDEIKDDTNQIESTTNHIDKTENIPQENTISQTTNNIHNTISTTTHKTEKTELILTTIEQIMNTTYIDTTVNEISTNLDNILSTIREIPTTLKGTIIQTTTEIIKYEETCVVIIGFSHFRLFTSYFTFYIYLIPTKNNLYTKQILFPMIITYYRNNRRNIRRLSKESKANCTLELIESSSKYKYFCQVDEETANIKEIKAELDFDFVTQRNVTLSGVSPIANIYIYR